MLQTTFIIIKNTSAGQKSSCINTEDEFGVVKSVWITVDIGVDIDVIILVEENSTYRQQMHLPSGLENQHPAGGEIEETVYGSESSLTRDRRAENLIWQMPLKYIGTQDVVYMG